MYPYAGKDLEKWDCFCTTGGNRNGADIQEKSVTCIYHTVPLLSVYTREMKTYTRDHISIFIVVLFLIA